MRRPGGGVRRPPGGGGDAGAGRTGALARAKGIELSPEVEDKLIASVAAMPKTLEASMATDLEQGNRLELPWLNGAVVRLGQEFGVSTATHAEVVRALEPFVEGRAT